MFIAKLLLLAANIFRFVTCANFDFNFMWYENSTSHLHPNHYQARHELPPEIENATKIVLNHRVPVLLRRFDLSFAPNVRTLVLNKCQINDIEPGSFARMPASLKNLTLSGNNVRIVRDGVFNFVEVEHLDLSHNKLSTVKPSAFDNMPELMSLNLDYNELTAYALSLENCPKLSSISVQYNFIQYLAEEVFKNLVEQSNFSAYFSYNKITKIHEDLFLVKEFKDLYLDHNEIRYFDYTLKKIDTLNLNVNRIVCVSKDLMHNELRKVKRVLFYENPLNCSCFDELVKLKNVLVARPDNC